CESCDWSQLVTWYKAVVISLVPCDLCDHSQISHVVSNEARSHILLTTIHVIINWPIKVPYGAPRELAQSKMAGAVYERQPVPALLPSGCLYTWAGRE
ncbi:unnamed protein product, partial [Staurois parvus]